MKLIMFRIEDEKSPSSSPKDLRNDAFNQAPKTAPLPQAAIRRMINERAIELRRWFEKTESVFGISECAEGKKVKFAAATLPGPALTWWNAKVATIGLETVNQMP
ncbi:hypothetical protein Tco_0953882 [Tanacetum coccineum]|uniref:Reverse transcriptase domain-containing protein n=1 Tax=Tanacetum coccineum TaxID=301880 RepID=A0ABQ5E365_9ASTR